MLFHNLTNQAMRQISDQLYNDILSQLDSGHSTRQIALQLGVGHMTVSRICSAARNNITKCSAGRPPKLTVADKRHLVRMVTTGKAATAVQAAQEFGSTTGTKVCKTTVREVLKQAGLKASVRKKKPKLSVRHMKQRMEFALRHQYWTEEDWNQVIWSDETKMPRLGYDGCKWVWRKPGTALSGHDVKGTVKFGGGSLMMWGCMTAQGVGYACHIDGHMDADTYTHILNTELLQTVDYYGLDVDSFIFQQDNDPKHTSKQALNWLASKGIQLLEWLAQSPDLNPIEHLWAYLKRRLAEYDSEPKGILELLERVDTEWNKIPPHICRDLIRSMPERIQAVLKTKGGFTKY